MRAARFSLIQRKYLSLTCTDDGEFGPNFSRAGTLPGDRSARQNQTLEAESLGEHQPIGRSQGRPQAARRAMALTAPPHCFGISILAPGPRRGP